MKNISEKEALERLDNIKTKFRQQILDNYEHKAKNCLTCETKGICCLDAHFVNVHISKLEAVAINKTLETLEANKQNEIFERISQTIEKYSLLDSMKNPAKTFACPLFEQGIGCLVHSVKPIPCIQHACYENKADLPPDELQTQVEEKVENLNKRTYGKFTEWLPLPVYLALIKNKD